jgi:hypothetical protein
VTNTTVAVSASQTGSSGSNSTIPQGQASVATIPKSKGSTATTVAVTGGNSVNSTSTTEVESSTTAIPSPDAPQVKPGEAAAMVDGKSVAASISRSGNKVTASVVGISATIFGLIPEGEVVSLDSEGNLRLSIEDQLAIDASGYAAGQDVSVWVYSTPSRLGVVTADESGNISGIFDLPAGIDSGDHRVVLEGANEKGQPVIMGVGILVGSLDSSSKVSRLLIIIPVLLAILVGLFIPAVSRRRKRQATA